MMVRARSFAALAIVAALPLAACSVTDDTATNQTVAAETPATRGNA